MRFAYWLTGNCGKTRKMSVICEVRLLAEYRLIYFWLSREALAIQHKSTTRRSVRVVVVVGVVKLRSEPFTGLVRFDTLLQARLPSTVLSTRYGQRTAHSCEYSALDLNDVLILYLVLTRLM